MKVTAHKMVEQLVREMAENTYDDWASRSNKFYAKVPNRRQWVHKNLMLFLEPARETLGKMLASEAYDESTKKKIYDALIADNMFKHARDRAIRGNQVHGVEID